MSPQPIIGKLLIEIPANWTTTPILVLEDGVETVLLSRSEASMPGLSLAFSTVSKDDAADGYVEEQGNGDSLLTQRDLISAGQSLVRIFSMSRDTSSSSSSGYANSVMYRFTVNQELYMVIAIYDDKSGRYQTPDAPTLHACVQELLASVRPKSG